MPEPSFTDMITRSVIIILAIFTLAQLSTIVVPGGKWLVSSFNSAVRFVRSIFKNCWSAIRSRSCYVLASIAIYHIANRRKFKCVALVICAARMMLGPFTTSTWSGTLALFLTMFYAARVFFKAVLVIRYKHAKFFISERMSKLKQVMGFWGVVDPDEVEVEIYLLSESG